MVVENAIRQELSAIQGENDVILDNLSREGDKVMLDIQMQYSDPAAAAGDAADMDMDLLLSGGGNEAMSEAASVRDEQLRDQQEKEKDNHADRCLTDLDNSFKQALNGFPGFENLVLNTNDEKDKQVEEGAQDLMQDDIFGGDDGAFGTEGFDDMFDGKKFNDEKMGLALQRGQFGLGRDTI